MVRLGHEVEICNPYEVVRKEISGRLSGALHFRTGYRFLKGRILDWLRSVVSECKGHEAVWIESGELFGKESLLLIRSMGIPVILFNHDDPTGNRDSGRFGSLISAIPHYDACAVVRDCNLEEFRLLGAKRVFKVWRTYDEFHHRPFEDPEEIKPEFRSDVAFVGTWMRSEGRDTFLLDLIERGIPVSIWGARWQKSTFWRELKPYYRGGNIGGRDYVAAVQGAKVCLGLLSKGNRDLHTTRSMEIPYAGGLLCAERTSEHLALYQEDSEALFWKNAEECAAQCRRLLEDDEFRESVRQAGMKRVRQNMVGNESVCAEILNQAVS